MQYTLIGYEQKGQDPRGNYKLNAQFKEAPDPVYWAVKSLPQIGQLFDGEIENGDYGPRFKRAFAGQVSTPQPSIINIPNYIGNREDGQKQGMCINNAAAYILSLNLEFEGPEQWAKNVRWYAAELYKAVGDLNEQPQPQVDTVAEVTEEPINLDNLDIFSK